MGNKYYILHGLLSRVSQLGSKSPAPGTTLLGFSVNGGKGSPLALSLGAGSLGKGALWVRVLGSGVHEPSLRAIIR